MNVPLVAETITSIGSFPITNTLINSTLMMVVFVVMAYILGRSVSMKPGKLQNGFEWIVDTLLGYFD